MFFVSAWAVTSITTWFFRSSKKLTVQKIRIIIYPNENNNQALYAGSEKDILLEVDLNGKIRFDVLLFAIYNQLNIPYKIINADLEYINGNNFGNVHLQLKVNSSSVTELDDYLKKYKLVNSKIDVIQKKEAS